VKHSDRLTFFSKATAVEKNPTSSGKQMTKGISLFLITKVLLPNYTR
jgi:hypothetical protein